MQERVQKLEPVVKRALERRLERVAAAERDNALLSGELERLAQTTSAQSQTVTVAASASAPTVSAATAGASSASTPDSSSN